MFDDESVDIMFDDDDDASEPAPAGEELIDEPDSIDESVVVVESVDELLSPQAERVAAIAKTINNFFISLSLFK